MLVAILLVALGTIIAVAIAYESAMSARRSSATFDFDEALLVAQGAEGLAAYGLRAVMQSTKSGPTGGGDIYPAQPWSQPVGPLEVVPGVTLEAQLEDLQGRFNLNWLGVATNGQPDKTVVQAFTRLLESLGLEPKWTDLIIDWIDQNQTPRPEGAEDSAYLSQSPPYLTANQYITSISELLALRGFTRENFDRLAPYISALPPTTGLNICSARGKVLDAFTPSQEEYGRDEAAFEKMRSESGGCFPPKKVYENALGPQNAGQQTQSRFATSSNYFRLSSLVTIGTAEFNLYSLLYVDSSQRTHVLMRTFTPD